MPQRRKVPSLQSLCLRNVGFTVERMAEKIAINVNVDEDVQKTRDYLNELMARVPHCLHEHIAIEVLEGVKRVVLKTSPCITKLNILGRINETVLNPKLKCLNISMWPHTATYNFYPNLQDLIGLEKLELAPLHNEMRTTEYYIHLAWSISLMKKLKSFTFKFSCTDRIVRAIGNHCQDIEYLNFDWSCAVTNESIPHLLKCRKLRTLIIAGCSISVDRMTHIIIGLPNLLQVNYIYFNAVITKLKMFYCGPFELRKAQSCDDLKENLKLLVDLFPKMEYVDFYRPISELPILASLENLNTLILRMCEIKYDYLKQLLKVRGGNITSLYLDGVEGVDIQHIIDIGLYCPNLKCLGLIDCEYTNSVRLSDWFDEPLFTNLRKVYYLGIGGMGILQFVLSHAFNIQVIDVRYEILPDITHSFVENVLSANPMRNLEEFSVSMSTYLNMRTVELLLESCVNLKVLSCLEEWTGICENELKTLKKYISSHNFDVQYFSSPLPTDF